MADDTRINWQDYYGLNADAYKQQAQGLLDPLATQDAQLRRDVSGAARGAYQRGVMGQPGADWQTQQAQGELMSYGDAVAALQNPATLQAALEGSGHRPVSALDAAGTRQAGGDDFRKASSRYEDTSAYARQATEKAALDYQRGQGDEARLARQRADATAAAAKAAEDEKARRAAWQKQLEAGERGAGRVTVDLPGAPGMEVADGGDQQRADEKNLGDLFGGRTSEGSVSERLRNLYHQGRNPLAAYGVKGNY